MWRLKTRTAVVLLFSYRNKKLFVWAVTDRQTDIREARRGRRMVALLALLVTLSGTEAHPAWCSAGTWGFPFRR